MKYFISHNSSIECLRSVAQRPSSTRAVPTAGHKPTGKRVRELHLERFGISEPVHLTVAEAADRGQAGFIRCHVAELTMPHRSFVKLEEGLYVDSPELCFVRGGIEFSVVKLIRWGFEMCGSYSLSDDDPHGFFSREPLTSVDALQRYLSRASGLRGVKRAVRAMPYVMDGSASPMETRLVMLLCLPPRLGGYGLPRPVLNLELDETRRSPDGRGLACDLLWPEFGFAVEYDSDLFHNEKPKISKDSIRRSSLGLMGYDVLTVAREQVLDARELDKVANILADRMGRILNARRSDAMTRRFALRREIFDDMGGVAAARERVTGALGR